MVDGVMVTDRKFANICQRLLLDGCSGKQSVAAISKSPPTVEQRRPLNNGKAFCRRWGSRSIDKSSVGNKDVIDRRVTVPRETNSNLPLSCSLPRAVNDSGSRSLVVFLTFHVFLKWFIRKCWTGLWVVGLACSRQRFRVGGALF